MISWVRKSHLCSTSLISSALSQIGRSGASIASSSPRAEADLLRQRREIVVEPLFPRYQPERHVILLSRANLSRSSAIYTVRYTSRSRRFNRRETWPSRPAYTRCLRCRCLHPIGPAPS